VAQSVARPAKRSPRQRESAEFSDSSRASATHQHSRTPPRSRSGAGEPAPLSELVQHATGDRGRRRRCAAHDAAASRSAALLQRPSGSGGGQAPRLALRRLPVTLYGLLSARVVRVALAPPMSKSGTSIPAVRVRYAVEQPPVREWLMPRFVPGSEGVRSVGCAPARRQRAGCRRRTGRARARSGLPRCSRSASGPRTASRGLPG
jgi:hypothetical protein